MSINDTNGNLKAKVQEESTKEKVIETPSESLRETDVDKPTVTTEKVTKKAKGGSKESSVGDLMKAAFCDKISSPLRMASAQAMDGPSKPKKGRKQNVTEEKDIVKQPAKRKDSLVATRIMTRKTRKSFKDM